MKRNLGYIKETMMTYFNEDNNSQNDLFADENNIIDTNNINDNFEYSQSTQQTQTEEDFDYTLLKIIIFLIFV